MQKKIELLDCTLRDGAYITNSEFGDLTIKGIIKKLQNANIEVVECGWLKDGKYQQGTTYFHVPNDLLPYINKKESHVFVAMIDWDRYDLNQLPVCDGRTIDAIRVVFPHGKHNEAVSVALEIKKKGYQVFLQAANTLAYSEKDLRELSEAVNKLQPVAISIVDTFGSMLEEDLEHMVEVLHRNLDDTIKLGFHSHNNMQLSFSLSCHFIKILDGKRDIIVDASLNGMGRGAGNATTELVANILNRKYHKNYDMNEILDAIDLYMLPLSNQYNWGYSTPYFIAGMYQCHVNNIKYLLDNHRTNSKDMRNIIRSLSTEERRHYDYNLLESKYVENQNRVVDDEEAIHSLENHLKNKSVLLIGPGATTDRERDKIVAYIHRDHPIVIFVNAINKNYKGDYLFLINSVRYDYAKAAYRNEFDSLTKILLSNIKTETMENEYIINFDRVMKRGWEHFDNAVISCLRLMDKVHVRKVGIAGFDGFRKYDETYADKSLPTRNPDHRWEKLNAEVQEMYDDFKSSCNSDMKISFVTTCMFEKKS